MAARTGWFLRTLGGEVLTGGDGIVLYFHRRAQR
jgi:hypothetical protein